jgi:hypothetical protein
MPTFNIVVFAGDYAGPEVRSSNARLTTLRIPIRHETSLTILSNYR